MRIIQPSVDILNKDELLEENVLKRIERAGRVCYKSEDKITDGSAERFVRMLIKNGHEAMLEHSPAISVKFTCDRGVSHEIVRHRLFSFAQESTRYVNYDSKEMQFIEPCFWRKPEDVAEDFKQRATLYNEWKYLCQRAEESYKYMIRLGASPQEARSILPNSLKTELIVTGNVREWRHFFKLRTAPSAHPQMREVACMALIQLYSLIPVVFDEYFKEVENGKCEK